MYFKDFPGVLFFFFFTYLSDLVSPLTRSQTSTLLSIGRVVLTTGPPGKSLLGDSNSGPKS